MTNPIVWPGSDVISSVPEGREFITKEEDEKSGCALMDSTRNLVVQLWYSSIDNYFKCFFFFTIL